MVHLSKRMERFDTSKTLHISIGCAGNVGFLADWRRLNVGMPTQRWCRHSLCPVGHRGHIACLQQRWAIWDVGSLWKYARCCFRFANTIFPKKACMDFTLAILGMIRWCWHELDVDCWFLAMQPPWSRSWDTVKLKLVRCSTVAACGIWLSNVFRKSFKDCRVLCCFSF